MGGRGKKGMLLKDRCEGVRAGRVGCGVRRKDDVKRAVKGMVTVGRGWVDGGCVEGVMGGCEGDGDGVVWWWW